MPQQGMGAAKSGMGADEGRRLQDGAGKGMNNMQSMPRK